MTGCLRGVRNVLVVYAALAVAYVLLACREPPSPPPLSAAERARIIEGLCGAPGRELVALRVTRDGAVLPDCGEAL